VHLARREFPAARVVRAVQGGRGIDNEQGKAGLAWGVAVAVGGSGNVAVAVAVAVWHCGRVAVVGSGGGVVAGEKMERIGCVLRELWVFVGVTVVGWQWGWQGGSGRSGQQCISVSKRQWPTTTTTTTTTTAAGSGTLAVTQWQWQQHTGSNTVAVAATTQWQ
jgi:hypothetical protein